MVCYARFDMFIFLLRKQLNGGVAGSLVFTAKKKKTHQRFPQNTELSSRHEMFVLFNNSFFKYYPRLKLYLNKTLTHFGTFSHQRTPSLHPFFSALTKSMSGKRNNGREQTTTCAKHCGKLSLCLIDTDLNEHLFCS